uniref:UHRF1-binding protein 1-like n=2 Tax=Lygus hesperus TaxID=30085 RepID=A0A146KWS5_LYGHE
MTFYYPTILLHYYFEENSVILCCFLPFSKKHYYSQNKFNTRSRGWTEVCDQPSLKPKIKIRKEHDVVNTPEADTWTSIRNHSLFNDMLTAALANIDLTLNASTLASFAEFFVDDIASPPLPLKVELEKIAISLVDDKTESNAVNSPVNLNISRLYISRSKDGIVNIDPSNLSTPNASSINQETVDLKQENEQLRRRLAATERLTEENHRLRKCEEEAQELRSCLNDAQDTLTNLLHEKESLLEIIRNFQNNKSDRKQQSSGKR